MADDALELPVRIPGASQAAGDLDKVSQAGTRTATAMDRAEVSTRKTASSFDMLRQKLGSGEVLRNAAASAVLLSSSASGSAEKVAALAGALATIPGPVGAISAVVAVGATIWGTYGRTSAEAAAKAKQASADALAAFQRATDGQIAAQAKLAAAARSAGPGARLLGVSGASRGQAQDLAAIAGGDSSAGVAGAAALAESGLAPLDQEAVIKQLDEAARIGAEVSGATITAAIKAKQDEVKALAARAQFSARQGALFSPTSPIEQTTDTRVAGLSGITGLSESVVMSRLRNAASPEGQMREAAIRAPIASSTSLPDQELRNFQDALRDATNALRQAKVPMAEAAAMQAQGWSRDPYDKTLQRTSN